MHPVDLAITILPLLLICGVVFFSASRMKSVADFLSGGRNSRRYLMAVAKAEMTAGAVVFVAYFEQVARSGFVVPFWSYLAAPVTLLVTVFGFVVYRFRETRALTLAQFFELRYSRRFRFFTGILGFLAGILNFAIMPAIGAKFFVYFLRLPENVALGGLHVPTYAVIMAILLGLTLFLALSGGMVTLILTNCIEGILSQVLYLVIIVALVMTFSWTQISEVLSAQPPGQSLLNPFDSLSLKDFNLWFVLMSIVVGVYGTMAWQNQGGYNSAGLDAHETRMGNILGRIREIGKSSLIILLGVCGITFLHHPTFATQAADALAQVNTIADAATRSQMTIPIALSHILPIGAAGALCSVLLMGILGGDSNHLHSWGSIFVQDILLPLRKTPFSPKSHLLVLRCAIVGVAIFAFAVGLFFQQTQYVLMWWSVTMALYIGGAGAVIIGGLYWKKGTTAAAWVALLTGSGLSLTGLILRQVLGQDFPLNGMQVSFFSSLLAILSYVLVSFLTCRKDFDLDRMLHRGIHARHDAELSSPRQPKPPFWMRLIGVDSDFSKTDFGITIGVFLWVAGLFMVFIACTIIQMFHPLSSSFWSGYWHVFGYGVPILAAVLIGVWFTWGGIRDMADFMRRLRLEKVNVLDDGTVVGRENLDEVPTRPCPEDPASPRVK